MNSDIRFENISFSHPDKPVLKKASAIVYQYQLNSFVGLSGAGKTTLVDLLCGLHQTGSGQILINGIPLNELDTRHWRRQIGYVTQENSLLNSSVKDNVSLGDPNYSNDQIITALAKAKAMDFVAELPMGI